MQEFMKDRYGVDDLTIGLGVLSMLLALIGSLAKLSVLTWIALAVVIIALLRAFSKNIAARKRENAVYLDLVAKVPAVGSFLAPLSQGKGAGASSRSTSSAAPQAGVELNPRQAHRPAYVARAQRQSVLPLQELRLHPLRPARQGPYPRHMPQVRHQGRETILIISVHAYASSGRRSHADRRPLFLAQHLVHKSPSSIRSIRFQARWATGVH